MTTDKEDPLLFEKWLRNFFVDPNTSFIDFQTFRLDVFEYPTHYLLEALFEKKHVINITISIDMNTLTILAAGSDGSLERSFTFPFSIEDRTITPELSTDALLICVSKNTIEKGTPSIWKLEVP
ncbi:hypothetical protein MHI18_19870 [Peribacillus sp. FSL H8-0477]|uniref:hypothetical protein n=1 Tax=Peribacillus sp. FSL H8-0477 TaxID=2921388 RepID=UPI0030FBD4DA